MKHSFIKTTIDDIRQTKKFYMQANCENFLNMSNGSSIEFVEQCVHLGTKIYSYIYKKKY